jgi:ribosomal protein S18 acetylase RimI-like enzyme
VSATAAIVVHDGDVPEADAAIVDNGIGRHNEDHAPLHEVRPLACMARIDGRTVGGAIGRTWGRLAELQQLWVDDGHRRCGLGCRLMTAFEDAAAVRGVTQVYLDTFTFQAPDFYRGLGYRSVLELAGFAPGIVKFTMVKSIGATPGARAEAP